MTKNILSKSLIAATSLTALLLSSCATKTPEARIKKYPTVFEQVPEIDRELVSKGEIKEGMSKQAVFLAWGKADQITKGSKDGVEFERWLYTSLSPIYRSSFNSHIGFGHGFGRGGFGRGGFRGGFGYSGFRRGFGHSGFGVGFSPRVSYIQTRAASVDFDSNHRVKSWYIKK